MLHNSPSLRRLADGIQGNQPALPKIPPPHPVSRPGEFTNRFFIYFFGADRPGWQFAYFSVEQSRFLSYLSIKNFL